MPKQVIDDLEDWSCPWCGRFYFLPDEELLGMRIPKPTENTHSPDSPRGVLPSGGIIK